ncbi:EAL domain-containing protein [Devosia sp. 1566]|uniref:putative bifunctional diguanylate cyclase/phosphodiesterase n=1 Tax=Devosia sp. 1566 TaxID=2499144 RepID=UPI000FD92748|nr:EAL domain-containing protein [Devosia sp. 1566]
MGAAVRFGVTLACLVLLYALAAGGGLRSIDAGLRDVRLALNAVPASGSTVVVDIDSESLAEIGVWPWPRSLYAQALDRLVEAGAAEVAFDIDFSSASTPAEDQQLAQALERAGGYAYLAAFQQLSGAEGELALSMPMASLLEQASPVLVNVFLDSSGQARSFLSRVETDQGEVRALPVELVPSGQALPRSVNIDFSIDARTIPRIPFADVLAGRADPTLLQGKQVIIGASAIELRDLFSIPRFGIVAGPVLQAVAVETLKSGRIITDLRLGPSAIALVLMALALLFLRSRLRLWQIGLLAAGLGAVWEVAALVTYRTMAVSFDTGFFHGGIVVLLVLAVVDEAFIQYRGRIAALRRLSHLARHDQTTGALSRAGLIEAAAPWGFAPKAVILVRVQRLNLLRASLGHEVTDSLLHAIGERLSGQVPGLVGYVADDSFAWAYRLERPDMAVMDEACRSLSARLGGIYDTIGHRIHVEVRCGYSAGPLSVDDLLNQAETALLQADAERAPFVGYSPTDQQRLEERRQLDLDLRHAVEDGQLEVVFQPQIDLRTRTIVGAEALLRWRHPQLGMISPAQFIPLAEETGLIVDLGRWILEEACSQAMAWPWEGRMSVNVSPVQLQLSDVPAMVAGALVLSGLPPKRLDIEITESSLVAGIGGIIRTFAALKGIGVDVALDDFGTGYSSLSYLKDLPFDKLKIDQSFVRAMGDGAAGDVIVASIIGLGRSLGKTTVAEGIEDEAAASALAAMGCSIGQGYYFGRPVDGPTMRALVETNLPLPQAASA